MAPGLLSNVSFILICMPKFSLASILFLISLIPIGLGFVWGLEMNAMIALMWLFPTEYSGGEISKWGWPVNAQKSLEPYFGGQLLYPVTITHKAGSILVVAMCAALGTLRLRAAKLVAWSLMALLPFSVALWNLRTIGQAYVLPPDYVVAAEVSCMCFAAWWSADRATERWLYKGIEAEKRVTRRQKLLFAALAVLIVVTSMSGWLWLQRIQDYMKENSLFQQ